MMVTVRAARPDDTPAMQEIERLSGERFREVGLDHVADDEPASVETLTEYASHGRAWVAVEGNGRICGYVIADDVDGAAHIEQISVMPECQRQGIGRALIERVGTWAAEMDRPSMTLTTFSDVPWNRPLYEHLGFRVVSEEEVGPGLRTIRDRETAEGLDPSARVVMRFDLSR
jgi:ribosomal protein S18 acetylase RimI-like enzyme